MATPLTLYFDKVAAVTVTTDGALASATGGTLGNTAMTLAAPTSTGYGELNAITAGTYASAGSLGSPSDNGFLWDVTTLENQQTVTGNWVPTLRLQIGGSGVTGTMTADLYVLISKRASSGTKTLQGTCLLSAQTLTTTVTSFTFANTSLSAINFAPGDKLLFNVWTNVTTNSTAGGTPQLKLFAATTSGQGVATAQVVTPGYQAQTVSIVVTNAGLNLLRDGMSGATTPTITYVAIGTSNATPQTTDTRLGNEIFRKKVTNYTNGANPGEVLINMYLAQGDAIGNNIQEVGFFGGTSASSTLNSGVLLAHGLYTHTKQSTESLAFQLDFTV